MALSRSLRTSRNSDTVVLSRMIARGRQTPSLRLIINNQPEGARSDGTAAPKQENSDKLR